MKKLTGTLFVLMMLVCRPRFSQPAIEIQSGEAYSINYEQRFAEHWSGRILPGLQFQPSSSPDLT
jgi:hypothetical protein